MTKTIFIITVFLVVGQTLSAQQKLPIIRATSKIVDIKDGNDFQKGNWHIAPEVKPDIFTVSRFRRPKRVTFYTDIDSISFTVEPEQEYNFIILLNEKDSAFTRLSTVITSAFTFKKKNKAPEAVADTIPFTIGKGNKIYIKGKINHSTPLDLMFDTGSDQEVISSKGLDKNVQINFNDSKNSISIGGVTTAQYSKTNQLEIGNMVWDNIPIAKIDGADADGIVGYNVFDGKIVEINYDSKIMVIHSQPFKVDEGYEKLPMAFKGNLPFIEGTLTYGNRTAKGYFEFDAGSNGSLWINKDFAKQNRLYGSMKNLGKTSTRGFDGIEIDNETVLLPKLSFGKYAATNVPIDLELPSEKETLKWGILGMDLLKRFNVILDFQNDYFYLKPNTLIATPYNKPFNKFLIFSGLALFLGLLVTVFIVAGKAKKVTKQNSSNKNMVSQFK